MSAAPGYEGLSAVSLLAKIQKSLYPSCQLPFLSKYYVEWQLDVRYKQSLEESV